MSTLSLSLKFSQQLTLSLIILHLLVLLALSFYNFSFMLKLILSFLVLIHAGHVWQYYVALLNKGSIHNIILNTRGEWQLHQAENEQLAVLLPDSIVTQYLVILNFKTSKFLRVSVPIMRDSVSAEEWRKLRVYLEIH